ncbi:hypothetical protein AJ79_06299 [Helicocarpus griseus UAMH5409]|uniref:Zn(2)-C6 fungal-type domain-containing protein n=1 Tax=Helicocarpus griseus UAMH5409 TaxID=1447875 RepID=A0A2B7XFH7_9EURO|nr:hypothetical protein AJ79_06299 [Helicocarpus griseus UAMH5409]
MPLSRKKSCVRCRQSKLRCNQAIPSCSRCIERGTRCLYDDGNGAPYARHSASRTSTPQRFLEELSDSIVPQVGALPSSNSASTPSMFIEPLTEAGDPRPGIDFELDWIAIDAAGSESFNLPKLDPALSASATLSQQPNWTGVRELSETEVDASGAESTSMRANPSYILNSWFLERTTAVSADSENDTSRVSLQPRRILQRRQILRHCALSAVVVGQLTSFPKMMIQGERLPPFIRPPCYMHEDMAFDCAKSRRHKCLSKELAICASLVEMFYSRTAQNAEFVWKTIYAEKDRLKREHESLDMHQRLAALQAITVYIILQAQDVESADANGAHSLISTAVDIATSVSQRIKPTTNTLHDPPSQQRWVHNESASRTLILLIIMDLLLDGFLEARNFCNSVCNYNFHKAPLPATRDLWEAPTNFSWRTEYEKYNSRRKARKTLTIGDLLELDKVGALRQSDLENNEVVADILTWCEGLDSLGSLLWQIVPFQQWRARGGMGDVW